jgi:hypothetical protein
MSEVGRSPLRGLAGGDETMSAPEAVAAMLKLRELGAGSEADREGARLQQDDGPAEASGACRSSAMRVIADSGDVGDRVPGGGVRGLS